MAGECGERQLNHSDGEAERFYRDLKQQGTRVRVGMEATGYSRWFERLLAAPRQRPESTRSGNVAFGYRLLHRTEWLPNLLVL
jgi:hypothetical protein